MDYDPISFPSVELAWFWTVRTLHRDPAARPDSGRRTMADVIKCLDTLYRNRRIDLLHVRIMRLWGLRGIAPNPGRASERSDWRIWHEAMTRLEPSLRARGMITAELECADEAYGMK